MSRVQILRHKKRGDFRVIVFRKHPKKGMFMQVGHPVAVEQDIMETKPLATIFSIINNATDAPFATLEDEMSPREERQYQIVSLRMEGEKMELTPLRRSQGGHIGFPEERVSLPKDVSESELSNLFRELFSSIK